MNVCDMQNMPAVFGLRKMSFGYKKTANWVFWKSAAATDFCKWSKKCPNKIKKTHVSLQNDRTDKSFIE